KDIMQVRNGIFATLDPNNPDLDEMDEVRSQLNEVTTSFNKQYEPIKKQSFLNQGYKFSIGNQTRFFGKPLGYNAALSYSKDYGYFKDGIYQVSENETIDPWKEVNDQYGEIDVKITGLVNLNYKLSNNHKIGARFLKTQSGLDVARYREGYYGYETGFHIQERNLGFLERSLNVGQLEGKHILKNLNKTKIEWLTSYTFMRQDEPDLRYFPNLYTFNDNGEKENFRVFSNTSPVRYYREMFEHNMNAKIDITIPVRIASESSKFKFGGFYANKLGESDEFKFKFSGDTWVFPSGDIEELLNQPISIDNPNGFFYEEDMKSDRILSYYGNQNSYGGYSMLDVSFSKIIRIVAGARIESSYIFVENKIAKTNSNYSDGELNELDVLPSINLTYHVIQNMNVRLGYFRTLARPIFKEISPTSYYDYKKGERINGNPDLERSLIDNFDLRWEYFFKPSEMVSISGFYKYFQNPIEMQMNEKQINREIQYINSDDSYLYGLEAEFRKSLDFFTPLKDFFIATNLSLIKSVTQVNDSITDRAYREETRPMMGQSPYILNSYLEYNNKNIQLNTNITFHTSGEKLIIITKPGTPYIYEQPFPLFSFNLSKGIGEYISINFKLKNIFNKSYEAVYHYDQMDYTYLKHKTGRTYSLGIKYLIK
ncbi:MAG: TonB-dependent receptor domain-containing protein, partial [bacterium]